MSNSNSNPNMSESQRLQLANMIKANDVEDQTDLIRKLKHSSIMKSEINQMVFLRAKHRNDPDALQLEAMTECNFLFTYYTDIYNKLRKNEIDLSLLLQFVDVLREIEEGLVDQHEASFKVGTILKEMYIDSALKKADKLNENEEPRQEPRKAENNMSWSEFKKRNNSSKKS
jgi:hypothetical protein